MPVTIPPRSAPTRPRRRLGACLVAAACLPLGACGPAPLSQDQVGAALVTTADIPGQGWSAGQPGDIPPAAGDGGLGALLDRAGGAPDACREALRPFSGETGTPSAYAVADFTQATGGDAGPLGARQLVVAVRSYEKDIPSSPDAAGAARACPTFELSSGSERLKVTLRPTTYAAEGASGLGLDLDDGTHRGALDLVWVARGATIVRASVTGDTAASGHDLLEQVVQRQLQKVADAG